MRARDETRHDSVYGRHPGGVPPFDAVDVAWSLTRPGDSAVCRGAACRCRVDEPERALGSVDMGGRRDRIARKARGASASATAFGVPVLIRTIRRSRSMSDALLARGVGD